MTQLTEALKTLSLQAFNGMHPILWNRMKDKGSPNWHSEGVSATPVDAQKWISLLTEEEIQAAIKPRGYFASLVDAGDSSGLKESLKEGFILPGEPYYQLQKDDEANLFEDDRAAVMAAIKDAVEGDSYAIEQLRLAKTDALVRTLLDDAVKHLISVTAV